MININVIVKEKKWFKFLKNPENEEALTSLLDKVEPYWNA